MILFFFTYEIVFDEACSLGKVNTSECQFIGNMSLDRFLAGN